MHQILRSYLKRLTNLTGSNRSLLLLKTIKEQDLDLHELNFNNDQASIELIKLLLAGKKKINLGSFLDSRDAKSNELSKQLKKIERRENFIYEERGARDLYVGWPFVRGKLNDGNLVRCPLLFFPVTLKIEDNKWMLLKREEENISFNKSFLLAYSYFNQVAIDDDFLETNFDDWEKDIQLFNTNLYQLLKDGPVEINFNQELFNNELKNFEHFKKTDFEEQHKNGELKLYPEAVLGIFPQAGSYLVPDYETMLNQPGFADLEEFFLNKTNQEDKEVANAFHYLSRIKEEQTFTPFRLDASQENAIKAIKKGNSMVIQGPPGTGKSQLICNLMADYMARGKKVLLVCQKKAALDVVYDRLKQKDLADFVGLVHDFKNDRPAIFKQIASQIDRLDEYKFKNNSLDTIQLERSFLQSSRRIDQITEELEEFKLALYDEKECGISVKELYLTSSPNEKAINLRHEFKFFKAAELESFPYKIKTWRAYASQFDKQDYVWADRTPFSNFTLKDLRSIVELLDSIPYYQAEISEKLREIFTASLDLEDCEWIANRTELIYQMISLLDNHKIYKHFVHYLKKNSDEDELIIRESKLITCFKEEGMEESLNIEQVGPMHVALDKAALARKHPLHWLKWKIFSKDKYAVQRLFVANSLEWNKEGFDKLISRVKNRMNFEHNLTRLKEMRWLYDIPEEKNQQVFENWFHEAHTALAAKNMLKELRSLKEYLDVENLSISEFNQKLLKVVEIVNQIPEDKKKWQKFLTVRQISTILYDYEYALQLKETIKNDFDSLVEYDKLINGLHSHERDVLNKLRDHAKGLSEKELIDLFTNSIKLEWIDQIESKYPILRSVASLKMSQNEEELQEAVKEKLDVSKEIVLLRTRERTYKNIDYNRLNNMVTYRDLNHQVTKKKKIWPIRKLVSNFYSELFELVPCWMASPESVSAIFPMEPIFDLVIFDEASQCFAEKGIPAMYRAHQVVITGDDKQLAPSDLYQARWEEEDVEIPELELDSLLDLGRKYLMEVQLRGHYRSRSLELIQFSNLHFYNNKLQLLPHFEDINNKELPIKYLKVDGIWENQSNQIEAQEVVSLTLKLIDKHPNDSIGIVTFNFKQQQLIADLLEERFFELKKSLPETLFVKNIENVQGDERDIIIFSTGYANDAKGKMNMNFGTLNAAKGENRLNVAITRARKYIYLISSILPHQLQVENTKHEGPKLFKKYLEYSWQTSQGQNVIEIENTNRFGANWLLKNKLNELTFDNPHIRVQEEFPFADLTIKLDKKYLGLILTDDNQYLKALSAKESHAYLPLSMKSKNWSAIRVYSREFWQEKQKINDLINKKLINA
jgi:hypothetical protein